MFKIIENGDGSTSVFCKDSGRLICTVQGRKPSAVAVGRPLVRKDLKRCAPSLPKADTPLEKKQRIEDWAASAGNSEKNSFVSAAETSSGDELTDDCVDQDSFLQVFDLVRTLELSCKGAKELRHTLPRRIIARVRPPTSTVDAQSSQRHFEDTELCSPLGVRLWQLRHSLNAAAQENAAKKYDKYCKFSVLSLHPNLTLHPALRNRESMKYSVTFRPPKSGARGGAISPTHIYSFSQRQRHQRYLQLLTGLDRESRLLQSRCKHAYVRLQRLTPKEIELHTSSKAGCNSRVALRRETLDEFRHKEVVDSEEASDDDCVVIAEIVRTGSRCQVPLEDVSRNLVLVGGRTA